MPSSTGLLYRSVTEIVKLADPFTMIGLGSESMVIIAGSLGLTVVVTGDPNSVLEPEVAS